MKMTDQAIRDLKNAPKRIEKGIKLLEKLGGKLLGFYTTIGEYDYVGIANAPNDKIAMTFLLALGKAGNVRTTTLKAYTREQYAEIIGELS